MGQESEETLRVVIMFMQAVVPAARDIMRMTARAAATGMRDAGRLTIQGATGIANGVADRLPVADDTVSCGMWRKGFRQMRAYR